MNLNHYLEVSATCKYKVNVNTSSMRSYSAIAVKDKLNPPSNATLKIVEIYFKRAIHAPITFVFKSYLRYCPYAHFPLPERVQNILQYQRYISVYYSSTKRERTNEINILISSCVKNWTGVKHHWFQSLWPLNTIR